MGCAVRSDLRADALFAGAGLDLLRAQLQLLDAALKQLGL